MTFQAKLTTKLTDYSVDDAIVELNGQIEPDELDEIVKTFLKQLYSDEIDAQEVLSEKLVEVEYFLSLEPPKPLEAIQHDDWVSCVDANETYIISGSYDNSIRIFSIADRKNLVTIQDAHEKPVIKVKFLKHTNLTTQVKKSHELYFISCGHDEISILRRLNTKSLKVDIVFVYQGHNRSVNCVDTNDDMVATGSFDKTLRLWSTVQEEQDEGLGENDSDVVVESAKKNKKQKTRSSEKSVTHTTKKAIMTLTGHQESVTGVKWLGSCNEFNSVASCSMDRSICIWDIEVGESKRRIHSAKPLLGIDFCRERNLIISASCDRFVRLWDARAPDNATAKTAFTSHSAWVSSVAFGRASTNHFISGGYDNMVKLWDIRSSKACLYDLIGHHDKVLDVNWSNPAYAMSGSADSTVKVFATN